MTEWLFENGIGERRAALVDGDRILEAAIERDGDGPRVGTVLDARLDRILVPGRRALATLPGGQEALAEPPPAGVSEGATFLAQVVREAIAESGAVKRARIRAAPTDAIIGDGPDLFHRIASGPHPVRRLHAHHADRLEAAGWSELLEEARSGVVAFTSGTLRISPTPAMTLIDVDGAGDLAALCVAGAEAAAGAIRRLGIAGSIGIDLPTAGRKDARLAAAEAVDHVLPQPFERTAVNGFGFLQIVRPRPRASLIERMREDPPLAAALFLLRRAERTPGAGTLGIVGAPAVIGRITAAGWDDALARRTGAAVTLHADPATPIWSGDVHRHPR